MPSPENLFGSIFFGAIGMAAFVYGKRVGSFKAILTGIIMMAYPYFVPQTWLLYVLGILMTVSLFLFRD